MKPKALLEAWEKHSGFDYGEIGHVDFKQFEAGWFACHKILNILWESIPDFEHKNIQFVKAAEPWAKYKSED